MWESIKLIIGKLAKRGWPGFLFGFFTLPNIFDKFFKPLLPQKWRSIDMPGGVSCSLFGLILFYAAFRAYHDLRKEKMNDFLQYAPEFKRDRVFREFYKLFREGELLRDASPERRQKWDEDILKQITTYCTGTFKTNYLLATKRRPFRVDTMKDIEPLLDENYEAALSKIKRYLDNDFNSYAL